MAIPLLLHGVHVGYIEASRQDSPKDIIIPYYDSERIASTVACVRDWMKSYLHPTYKNDWPCGVSGMTQEDRPPKVPLDILTTTTTTTCTKGRERTSKTSNHKTTQTLTRVQGSQLMGAPTLGSSVFPQYFFTTRHHRFDTRVSNSVYSSTP